MTAPQILALAALAPVTLAFLHILRFSRRTGSAALAAGLALAFAGYTGWTVLAEGFVPLWRNQTSNLWGVQVFWDLLASLTVALFLIAPRARAAGMALLPWMALVAASGSIGLLAMAARLFWLERQGSPG